MSAKLMEVKKYVTTVHNEGETRNKGYNLKCETQGRRNRFDLE